MHGYQKTKSPKLLHQNQSGGKKRGVAGWEREREGEREREREREREGERKREKEREREREK